MILFIIICIVIVLALIPLMVAGIFKANQDKLDRIKAITNSVGEYGFSIYKGKEYEALDEACFLRDQIEATKDTRRTAIANQYIRKIERIVKGDSV